MARMKIDDDIKTYANSIKEWLQETRATHERNGKQDEQIEAENVYTLAMGFQSFVSEFESAGPYDRILIVNTLLISLLQISMREHKRMWRNEEEAKKQKQKELEEEKKGSTQG